MELRFKNLARSESSKRKAPSKSSRCRSLLPSSKTRKAPINSLVGWRGCPLLIVAQVALKPMTHLRNEGRIVMPEAGCQIGIAGLGATGSNFALNLADHGVATASTAEKTAGT